MKFERIKILNYRQYKEIDLDLSSNKLQLIKGIMGTGKTNFLNAINWCLYQEEPYLSKKSQQLPLLNLSTLL
jgi:DNA sulfur modification protein DndD